MTTFIAGLLTAFAVLIHQCEYETAAHRWKETNTMITTYPGFMEKHCESCGAINWGGKEDGTCQKRLVIKINLWTCPR